MSETFPPSDTTEVDPILLDERRARWTNRLLELRPGWSPEAWRKAAREQLVFWIGRGGAHRALPDRLARFDRVPHGLSFQETFAAFFCFEPPDGPDFFEVPFLLAVAEGDATAVRDTADALGLDPSRLAAALFDGPFVPRTAHSRSAR